MTVTKGLVAAILRECHVVKILGDEGDACEGGVDWALRKPHRHVRRFAIVKNDALCR